MEKPTKENTLYLPIKQVYFDAIIDGTKKEEYREIKDTTMKKYLEMADNGAPYFYGDLMSADNPLAGDIYAYNDGVFPYVPKDIKYLSLAVGYNKNRDTALVAVDDISFQVAETPDGQQLRYNWTEQDGVIPDSEGGMYALWQIVYHLGEVIELNRNA